MEAMSARTKIGGIIGRGISHSLSPLLHHAAAQELGIDAVYLPFDVSTDFPGAGFFETMWEVGAYGFNVTVPYKEAAARFFDTQGLRSINTIFRGSKGWQVASTDGQGFLRGLDELGFELEDFESVIYLGNGGAALALAETFHGLFPPLVQCVMRRNAARDAIWKGIGLNSLEIHEFSASRLSSLLEQYPRTLLLQTTSAPLQGDRLESLAAALTPFTGVFIDLVYGQTSALLDKCRHLGVPHQDGIAMLVGQALLSEQLWWNQAVPFAFLESLARLHLSASS